MTDTHSFATFTLYTPAKRKLSRKITRVEDLLHTIINHLTAIQEEVEENIGTRCELVGVTPPSTSENVLTKAIDKATYSLVDAANTLQNVHKILWSD